MTVTAYEISVGDASSADRFGDLLTAFGEVTYSQRPVETVLLTEPVDQECLMALLARLVDLGLDLLEVRRLTHREGAGRAA